jgi:predicted nucleic acid-binding Zn ribbon protein
MTWRPLPDPSGARSDPRPLGESLDRVTRSLGGPDAAALSVIFGRWDEVVGAHVAAHAWPLALSEGTLSIAVDQPGWATQLTYLESDLRRRANDLAGPGVVRRVRVSVRPR